MSFVRVFDPELSSGESGIALVPFSSFVRLYFIQYITLSLLYLVLTLCNIILVIVLLWLILSCSCYTLDYDPGNTPVLRSSPVIARGL